MKRYNLLSVMLLLSFTISVGIVYEISTYEKKPTNSYIPEEIAKKDIIKSFVKIEESNSGDFVDDDENNTSNETIKPTQKTDNKKTEKEIFDEKFSKKFKMLSEKLKGFQINKVHPFIVVSNVQKSQLDRILQGTIKGCYGALQKQFFPKDPDKVIVIYLLPNAEQYNTFCKKGFGFKPSTPYGFYLPTQKAMIMNISTGTGTLVHEMVHPMVEKNFPNAPTWLNEGLGSLFEQCSYEDGKLVGLENWRLKGLQNAISKNKLINLKNLIETTEEEFRGKKSGLMYAEARYLCMYMQEKGVLEEFYKNFHSNYEKDKTGLKFVEKVLGKNIDEIQKEWIEWCKQLKFN